MELEIINGCWRTKIYESKKIKKEISETQQVSAHFMLI